MRGHGTSRRITRALFCLLCCALFSSRALPAENVDLLLVLAVDTSGSVNEERFELQKQGYATAFRNPRLLRAIQAGNIGAIGVAMTQWTGPAMQVWVLPWTRISDAASAADLAAAVAATPRQLFGGGTSISGAITHAATLFAQAPFTAPRHVIDLSGDGANNRGTAAAVARDLAIAQGITINGLPILSLEPDLDIYYRDNVIGGPSAFLIVAHDFGNFADAILRKLLLEIAQPTLDPDQRIAARPMPLQTQPGAVPASQEAFSCPSQPNPCIPAR